MWGLISTSPVQGPPVLTMGIVVAHVVNISYLCGGFPSNGHSTFLPDLLINPDIRKTFFLDRAWWFHGKRSLLACLQPLRVSIGPFGPPELFSPGVWEPSFGVLRCTWRGWTHWWIRCAP